MCWVRSERLCVFMTIRIKCKDIYIYIRLFQTESGFRDENLFSYHSQGCRFLNYFSFSHSQPLFLFIVLLVRSRFFQLHHIHLNKRISPHFWVVVFLFSFFVIVCLLLCLFVWISCSHPAKWSPLISQFWSEKVYKLFIALMSHSNIWFFVCHRSSRRIFLWTAFPLDSFH